MTTAPALSSRRVAAVQIDSATIGAAVVVAIRDGAAIAWSRIYTDTEQARTIWRRIRDLARDGHTPSRIAAVLTAEIIRPVATHKLGSGFDRIQIDVLPHNQSEGWWTVSGLSLYLQSGGHARVGNTAEKHFTSRAAAEMYANGWAADLAGKGWTRR